MQAEHNRDNDHTGDRETDELIATMDDTVDTIPTMQWVYNRIFLLAAAACLFFLLVYVGWGLLDIVTVPSR